MPTARPVVLGRREPRIVAESRPARAERTRVTHAGMGDDMAVLIPGFRGHRRQCARPGHGDDSRERSPAWMPIVLKGHRFFTFESTFFPTDAGGDSIGNVGEQISSRPGIRAISHKGPESVGYSLAPARIDRLEPKKESASARAPRVATADAVERRVIPACAVRATGRKPSTAA